MAIDRQKLRHLERLARIRLAPDEADRLSDQLDTILAYIDRLRLVDADAPAPAPNASGDCEAGRDDEPAPGLSRDEALAAAPDTGDGCIRVPRVFGRGDE